MAENLVQAVKEEFNVYPQGVEGIDEGRWVVVDYGPLIVHLFYDLEQGSNLFKGQHSLHLYCVKQDLLLTRIEQFPPLNGFPVATIVYFIIISSNRRALE